MTTTNTYEIFVDLDGVLADFVVGVNRALEVVHNGSVVHVEGAYDTNPKYRSLMWSTVARYQNDHGGELWYELPMMEDARELWTYVEPHNPQILSATGNPQYGADDQKIRWVSEQLGDHVVVNLTRKSHEKAEYAAPHRILIDDRKKSIGPWIEAGGIGILHKSAEKTIRQLKELGI